MAATFPNEAFATGIDATIGGRSSGGDKASHSSSSCKNGDFGNPNPSSRSFVKIVGKIL